MERLHNSTDDYYNIYLNGADGNGSAFTDVNFPVMDALYWHDAGEHNKEMSQLSGMNLTSMRISDPSFPGKTLWGPGKSHDDITPSDINQGYIGNCWVMAAVSTLAERDNRITDFMVTDALNPAGIYAVNMYTLGVPYTMIIDDWMFMYGDNTVFAGLGKDGSVWGALVEKAFGKYYGNYERLVAGLMADAVSALNGSPSESISHSPWGGTPLTTDDIWNKIVAAKIDGDIVTGGSKNCGSHDSTTNDGVACSHAYSILHTHELLDTSGGVAARLLKIRNPWGSERYAGNWSDDSQLWSSEYRQQILDSGKGLSNDNEGLFWIDIESYMANYDLTEIN